MTFAKRVRGNFERQGDRVALRFEGKTWSFADLGRQAESWHRFLDQLEVEPGERVAFMLPNGPDLIAIHLGNILAGRVSLPMNPRAKAPEIAAILEIATPSLIVVAADAEEELRAALRLCPATVHVLEERFIAAAFAAGERSPDSSPPTIRAADAAMLVFTSGTTGAPKAVVLSQGNLLAGIEALEDAWSLGSDDHLYLALPLFHVHGLGVGVHGMLALGHSITLCRSFDSGAALEALCDRRLGISLFYGVPTYYHRLVGEVELPVDIRLRLAVSGSAPLSSELHEEIRSKLGIEVLERYGMSETLMLVSNPLMGERRPGLVGLPLPGVELSIVAEDGRELEAGEEGEIRVRGPNVFKGYWRNEEATRAAFDEAGRLRTGDLGIIEPESGYLRISGRSKELIISGGFNVHPREVEEAILAHPTVEACAVSGLPHVDLGEAVAAWIVARPGFDLEALKADLEQRLSGYKRPRRYQLVNELPRTALGKLARHLLRENES